ASAFEVRRTGPARTTRRRTAGRARRRWRTSGTRRPARRRPSRRRTPAAPAVSARTPFRPARTATGSAEDPGRIRGAGGTWGVPVLVTVFGSRDRFGLVVDRRQFVWPCSATRAYDAPLPDPRRGG